MYILMQIKEENIDIQQVLLRCQSAAGDNRSSEILKQLENHKQYPPRLSLEVFRSQHARKHLKTDVTINGIEPQLKCPLFTLCPGIECTIVLQTLIITCTDIGTHPPQPIVEEPSVIHHYSSKHAFFLKSESIIWG